MLHVIHLKDDEDETEKVEEEEDGEEDIFRQASQFRETHFSRKCFNLDISFCSLLSYLKIFLFQRHGGFGERGERQEEQCPLPLQESAALRREPRRHRLIPPLKS